MTFNVVEILKTLSCENLGSDNSLKSHQINRKVNRPKNKACMFIKMYPR